jgi:hypothetical protein
MRAIFSSYAFFKAMRNRGIRRPWSAAGALLSRIREEPLEA